MNISALQSAQMAQQQAKAMDNVAKAEAQRHANAGQKVEKGQESNQELEKGKVVSENKQDTSLPKTPKENYKMDTQKIAELKAQFSQQSNSFKAMIRKMLQQQGIAAEKATNYRELFDQVVVGAETQAEAMEAISENGYWGVNKTSERILDFAKALAGEDPSKIETLKSAFKSGFESAKSLFGGKLPDLCEQTYTKVMEGFEQWEKEGSKESGEVKSASSTTNA